MVMLIVALATALAAFMATQQNLWQRQVESQFDRTQARRIGIAAIDWARAVLADDARSNNIDHEKEIWATRLPAMPVENGEVTGAIEDRQGLFNLNNLVRNGVSSTPDVAQLKRLLALLGLPAELADALADWMDTDGEARQPGGAEDAYYLALPHPYRAANRPLTETGELALVKGFDETVIARLRPFVTVLPQPGPVNVNFAQPEILAAMAENMSLADARILVQQRSGRPFKSVEDFRQRLPHGGIQMSDADIAVSSQFFLVTGRASIGHAQVTIQALLQRNNAWPDVVWQSVQ
ncbi:MAG: type II secretion system minor pseudopilin GspK [Nitrosomonadales bacterium]|nr:type II secretion system minor pseudopilin GspK [Nitrosomonadales bacterium]